MMNTHLVCGPGALVNAWVQTVIPTLPALVSVSCADSLGYLAPTSTINPNCLAKLLILFSRPGALPNGVDNAIVPPLSTILVVASR